MMLSFNPFKKSLFIILTLLLISSCGGGGGGDSAPRSRTQGTITGVVFDAPVLGASVEVYEYKNGSLGRKLGSAVTPASGHYSIDIESASMPLYIAAKGGSYKDPVSEQVVSENIYMASVTNYTEGSTQKVMVTPLTYLAAGLTEYRIKQGQSAANAVSSALQDIKAIYSFDVNTTQPIDITKKSVSSGTNGDKYGAILTAYSSFAYDLLKPDPDGGKDTYTSIHLAELSYQDIVIDGKLDGQKQTEGGQKGDFLFGSVKIDSDFYTHSIAEHIMTVASDPDINRSSGYDDFAEYFASGNSSFSVYKTLAQALNMSGTPSGTMPDTGPIPKRNLVSLDDTPPTVTYAKPEVLSGQDTIKLDVEDNIGVASIEVKLEYTENKQLFSLSTLACPFGEGDEDTVCWVDDSSFTVGARKSSFTVHLNTDVLGGGNINGESEARLVVYAADTIMYSASPPENHEVSIDFDWDNTAPVIIFDSPSAVQGCTDEERDCVFKYTLTGYVKEKPELLDGKGVKISISNSEVDAGCKPDYGTQTWCYFERNYDNLIVGQSIEFTVKATDSNKNQTEEKYRVYTDSGRPEIKLDFPSDLDNGIVYESKKSDGEINVNFIYNSNTYTVKNIETADEFLIIPFEFANQGLMEVNENRGENDKFDLDALKVDNLKVLGVPFISVNLSDPQKDYNGESTYGFSAKDLELKVEYYTKRLGEDSFGDPVKTIISNKQFIPKADTDDDADYISSMTYYLPFSSDLFGTGLQSIGSDTIQKLIITAKDPAKNTSGVTEVYFRTAFKVPEITIVSPFIDAKVQLERLNEKGKFSAVSNAFCITKLDDSEELDYATCRLFDEKPSTSFYHVYMKSLKNDDGDDSTHYYQWSDDKDKEKYISLAEKDGIGAYFNSEAKVTLYLTELSSYHTGLFESQWEKQQDRTASNAKRILSDVTSALESQDKAMLGFDPVGTSYATNKDLAQGIPNRVTKKYIHRFLLEGLTDIATEQGTTSIEFAKAFHKDLSSDGKADGKGAEGPITIGESEFPLSSDTYRKDLAAAYYKAATDNGVDSGLAQSQAEKFAHANPKLGEDNIFDTEGEKFDTEPPSIKLYNQEGSVVCETGDSRAIEKGRSVEGECIFSGEIELELIVQDDLTPVEVTEKKVSWIDGQNKEHDAEINFFPTSGNSEQIKSFELKINSKLADYDGVKSFKIKVAAQDIYQTSKEKTFIYHVDNQKPEFDNVDAAPEYLVDGESANLTLTFSEPVNNIQARLGDISLNFNRSEKYQNEWKINDVGPIELLALKDSISLVIESYSDNVNNQGKKATVSIPVKPVITIDTVTEDNFVHGDDVSKVYITGTTKGFKQAANLTVDLVSLKEGREGTDKVSGLKVNLDDKGQWDTKSINMSTWEYSEFTVTVSGKYAEGERSVVATKKALYDDKIKPKVSSTLISYDGEEFKNVLVDEKSAKVTLTFNERVTIPTASLNGQAISFEETGFSKVWVGTTQPLMLPSGSATAPLIVVERTYQDTRPQGNFGEGYTTDIPLKPVITLNDMGGSINASDAKEFIVSGTSKGFQTGAELTVTVKNKPTSDSVDQSNLPQYSKKIPVGENGHWQTETHDISDWHQGTIIITVTGENSAGQSAEPLEQTVSFRDNIAPTVANIEVNEGKPIVHNQEGVLVKVSFSERVEEVSALLDDGGYQVTSFDSTDGGVTWSGEIRGPVALAHGELAKTLTVTAYKDLSDNPAEQPNANDTATVSVKPLLQVDTVMVDNEIDSTEVRSVSVSGSSLGFTTTDEDHIQVKLTSVVDNRFSWQSDVGIGVNGRWFTTSHNMSDWPLGQVKLEVTGNNAKQISASSVILTEIKIIDTQAPEVVNIEVNEGKPIEHNHEGVLVKVSFSEPVKEVSALLEGVDDRYTIDFSGSESDGAVWNGVINGPIVLAHGELAKTFTVTAYKDLSDNPAEQPNANDTATVSVKPLLQVDTVMVDNEIDSTEVRSVSVSGSSLGFTTTDEDHIQVKLTSVVDNRFSWQSDVGIGVNGRWFTTSHNMSDWPLGQVKLEVTGNNAKQISASSVILTEIKIIDTQAPEVVNIEVNEGKPIEHNHEGVLVKVSFSEPVKEVSALLEGVDDRYTIDFSGSESDGAVWNGVINGPIVLAHGELAKTFTVTAYKDLSDNPAEQPNANDTATVSVKPFLTLDQEIVDNPIDSNAVVIHGSALGVASGALLKLEVTRDEISEYSLDVQVDDKGIWTTETLDWGDWLLGTYTVIVSGPNNSDLPSEVKNTITIE